MPPGVAVDAPQARTDATARMSRAYRVNLNVLALVALFTGGLLVFSTQALSVVRRRAQFALLRTLGLPRRRLVALLLVEGAAVGAAGSLLGLAAGYALAVAALRVFGGDLGAGFFRGVTPSVSIDVPHWSSSARSASPSRCWAASFPRSKPRAPRPRPRSRPATNRRPSVRCATPGPA